MSDDVVMELTEVRSKIDELLSKEDEIDLDVFINLWQYRDRLLRKLCQDRQSLIDHQDLLQQELDNTNIWLEKVQLLSSQVAKSLLKSTRNQKAIRSYRG